MRLGIIINNTENMSLLRFTETKLFFDANNKSTNFVQDCTIVKTLEEALAVSANTTNSVILNVGNFLTTTFRNKHKNITGTINAIDDTDIIKFDPDTYVGFKKKCHYPPGSKQLYIIENMLKTCLRSRKLVYLDNTEEVGTVPTAPIRHLYGLASGWKTIQLASIIGFDNLETITVYDVNETQLEHAKWAHSQATLPETCPQYSNTCGEYDPHAIDKITWQKWNNFPVKFQKLNLFDVPVFPDHSLVWVSNVFEYESTIFDIGWEVCKNTRIMLCEKNKQSIIM